MGPMLIVQISVGEPKWAQLYARDPYEPSEPKSGGHMTITHQILASTI